VINGLFSTKNKKVTKTFKKVLNIYYFICIIIKQTGNEFSGKTDSYKNEIGLNPDINKIIIF